MPASLKTAEVRCRVAPDIKEAETQVLAQCRLTVREAMRLFLHQVIAEKGLPFDAKIPNATTRAAMAEARAMSKAHSS